ncbi:hypothetical protein [Streptomyces sp. Ag109_O5-1]|uniref:hypothetical protein n=1 Tax=Streptomyces sp. Ag109_O5-1 TaxID=1938851 RepID=UPI000F50EC29|nr:hypothetical protein [Streptomyces sp. Ag109_O5-1]
MTSEQRRDLQNLLGFTIAADPDAVTRTLAAVRRAAQPNADRLAVTQAVAGALSLTKRLLAIEEAYATVRTTIARLEIANARGHDDYNLHDLAAELERAGIDLKTDYDAADDLARAAESEAL